MSPPATTLWDGATWQASEHKHSRQFPGEVPQGDTLRGGGSLVLLDCSGPGGGCRAKRRAGDGLAGHADLARQRVEVLAPEHGLVVADGPPPAAGGGDEGTRRHQREGGVPCAMGRQPIAGIPPGELGSVWTPKPTTPPGGVKSALHTACP